jgi:predicted transcriptional regulator
MLGITQAELAKAAGLSTTGLNNIERGNADPKASTLRAIQSALEQAGIVFQADGEITNGGRGVRLAGKKE